MRKGGLIVAAALLATAAISRAQAPAAPARAAGGTLAASRPTSRPASWSYTT